MNTQLKRITVTIDIDDDPFIDMLAIQALLHLAQWLHHEGITPARTTLEITPQ